MKDSRSILLLVVSVLLILVSCTLLWTWGFNYNYRGKAKNSFVAKIKDSVITPKITERDSLQKIYNATLTSIDAFDSTWTQADSLQSDLDIRLNEFYKLRSEIATILKSAGSKEDVDLARQKIGELQKRVNQLRDRNLDVETENKRLYALLQQLTDAQKNALQNVKPVSYENVAPTRQISNAATFICSELKLSAFMVDVAREEETIQALQADKFIGSFSVKNNTSQFVNTEIVVIILQPDGKTLQNSAWETGRFETKEGKKTYSCKIKFEYSKGETKRLSFSLNNEKFLKGNYTMQLYFNGTMIGKAVMTLI